MSTTEDLPVLRVSVRDLAGVPSPGEVSARVLGGHARLVLGQQVHDRFRAEFRKGCPDYQAEVRVVWRGAVRGRQVIVEGRADGLYPDAPVAVVGEGVAGEGGTGEGVAGEGVAGTGEGVAGEGVAGEGVEPRWVVQEIKSVIGPALGDAASSDAALGDAASSDAALGDAALGDAALGDAASSDAALGDVASSDAALGDAALGDAASSDAASSDAAESGESEYREQPTQLALEDLLEDLPDPVLESYRWQCALYAHLLSAREVDPIPATRLRGEVVLVDARTLAHEVVPVPYDPEAVEAFFRGRLETLLSERVEQERLAEVRHAFAETVAFPHPEMRPHQRAFYDNVAGAAESGLALLLSAPTGIGKTVAALVPMLRAALSANQRLLVVTAKVSQQELALDTLAALVPEGAEIRVTQMEARERSCPRDEMLCTVHACPLLRASLAPDGMAGVRARVGPGGVFRAEPLRMLAEELGLCPFEVGLFVAAQADVIVGDFNYAVHPQARLERFFAPGGRERLLLVDEAHNLPARARDFLSPTLARSRVRELAEGAFHGGHPVFARILTFLRSVLALLADAESEAAEGPLGHRATVEIELDRERLELLQVEAETWLLDYLSWAKSGERRPAAFVPRRAPGSRRVVDPFVGFCYDLLRFVGAATQGGDHMAHLVRRSPEDLEVQVFCKDPSRYLAARFRQFHAVVAMSATLEPLPFFADELGLSRLPAHEACAFPSPFPAENRCLVIDESVSTRFRERERDLPEVCRRIARMAAQAPGNYLAFFPSYALAETAALLIQASGAPVRVVRQRPGVGAEPLLAAFRQAMESSWQAEEKGARTRAGRAGKRAGVRSLVGVAVIGGVLAEGVDFAGGLAQGAFVVGPGLPAVTDERRLMQAYFEHHHGGQGFEYAFLYPGLSRVVQAAGRVIRGPTERGFIALFGRRFREPRYRDLLPGYWQEEVVSTEDPEPVIARFWSRWSGS